MAFGLEVKINKIKVANAKYARLHSSNHMRKAIDEAMHYTFYHGMPPRFGYNNYMSKVEEPYQLFDAHLRAIMNGDSFIGTMTKDGFGF